jgi:protein SCO1/2
MMHQHHWRSARTKVHCIVSIFFVLLSPLFCAAASPQWGASYFPNVTLTNQHGVPVRFYDDLLKGKSVAVNIIYTSCTDECPLETARMAEVQRLLGTRMGKDIVFYSISIDPEHDTPEVLKAYAEKFGVGPGWQFLTGKKEDIKLLTRKLGLSRTSDSANKDGHASSLMLGNEPSGQWMRNSAVDNPRFLVTIMNSFFDWKDRTLTQDYAQAKPLDISRGDFTFQSRCASCHTVGGGDRIGPDLMGVTQRRGATWLRRYMREPDKVLAEGDPVATQLFERYRQVRMPNLRLGDDDLTMLTSYIEQQEKAAKAQAAASNAGGGQGHAHHHH